MTTLPEQFSAARKAQVETQLDYVRQVTSKVVESTEKVIALNLSTSRASIEKSAATFQQLLSAKEPRDLLALTTQSQTSFDTLLAYGRELFSIASGTQAELIKSAASTAKAIPAALPVPRFDAAAKAPVEVVVQAAAPEPASQPEIALEVPVPEEAKPAVLAEAISEAVAEPEVPVLTAAPVEAAGQVELSGIAPVDAAPPAPGSLTDSPILQGKASDTPKTRKRK